MNVTLDDRPWAATAERQAVVAGLYLPADRAGEDVQVTAPTPAPTPTATTTLTETATTTVTETATETVTPTPVQHPGTVGGYIWKDANNNGVKDQGERGFKDIVVRVMPPAGVDEQVRATSTDADGFWEVKGLTPNQDYTIEYVVPGVDPADLPDDFTVDKDGRVQIIVHINPDQPVDLNRGVALAEEPRYQVVTERVTEKVTVTRVAPTVVTHTATAKPAEPSRSVGDVINRCAANAVESPLLYLFPVVVGAIFGLPILLPEINRQLAETGGNDALRAQLADLERTLSDPDVQRIGGAAFGVLYLAAAIAITYDWCANDYGQAKTSLGSSNR